MREEKVLVLQRLEVLLVLSCSERVQILQPLCWQGAIEWERHHSSLYILARVSKHIPQHIVSHCQHHAPHRMNAVLSSVLVMLHNKSQHMRL